MLSRRRDEIALVITAESGLCLKDSIYEVGRAYDVYSLAGQLAIRDDCGGLFLRHHSTRQAAPHLYLARTGAGRASRRSRHSITRST